MLYVFPELGLSALVNDIERESGGKKITYQAAGEGQQGGGGGVTTPQQKEKRKIGGEIKSENIEKKVDRQISGILRDKAIDEKQMYTNYDKQIALSLH